jgi:hypothetical protein
LLRHRPPPTPLPSDLQEALTKISNASPVRTSLIEVGSLTVSSTGANLAGAILAEADLSYAILTSANLFGANFTEANLTETDLTGALWPSDAAVPEGWQRGTESGRLKRGNGGATAS